MLALLLAVADARALPRDMTAETGSVLVLRGPDGAGDANALTGDVNGDGIGDAAILTSTFSRDASETYGYETGVIHVVSGARRGEGGLDPALITILAPTSSRGRNLVVAPAGDVDGDGLADVLVGAPDLRIAGVRRGAAYVVRGGLEPRTVDLDAFGGVQPDGFRVLGVTYAAGTSVDGVGDVDGDGLDDIAVGDPATYQGSVSIVHGRAGGADVDLAGAPPGVLRVQQRWGDPIGRSVGAVGDVDGDGAPDVVMTGDPMPPGTNENEIDPGGAYVLHGGAQTGTLTVQDLEAGRGGFPILGFSRAAGDGVDASGAGDANGDGLADVALALEGARAAYVVFGRTTTTPVRLAELGDSGYRIEHGGGGGVAPAGDQDGDGREDLLATSFEDAGLGYSPNAFVVPGQAGSTTVDLRAFDGTQERGTRISGLSDSAVDSLHRATSGGKDATGDDCADILLSSFALESVYLIAGDVRCRHGDDHVAVLEHGRDDVRRRHGRRRRDGGRGRFRHPGCRRRRAARPQAAALRTPARRTAGRDRDLRRPRRAHRPLARRRGGPPHDCREADRPPGDPSACTPRPGGAPVRDAAADAPITRPAPGLISGANYPRAFVLRRGRPMSGSRAFAALLVLVAVAATGGTAVAKGPDHKAQHSLRSSLTDENFYFIMADRFDNGSTDNDLGGLPPDRLVSGFDPTARLLPRRRPARDHPTARLHRGPRHGLDLAHAELQEPARSRPVTRRPAVGGLPRLLGHRLHPDRSAPRHQRGSRGARRRRARARDEGLLRHHHQPHRGRDRVHRGRPAPATSRRTASPTGRPPASRSTTATSRAERFPAAGPGRELPLHARSYPAGAETKRPPGSTT